MVEDNPRNQRSASWRWFAVPAAVIALLAAVLALTTNDDDPSQRLRETRVQSGSQRDPESEPLLEDLPATATITDINDGLVTD